MNKTGKIFWITVIICLGFWASHLNILAPIHEFGHMLSAFLTGGYGVIVGWSTCGLSGGNDFIETISGYIAELLFMIFISYKVIKKKTKKYKISYNLTLAFIIGYLFDLMYQVVMGEDTDYLYTNYGELAGMRVVSSIIVLTVFLIITDFYCLKDIRNTRKR